MKIRIDLIVYDTCSADAQDFGTIKSFEPDESAYGFEDETGYDDHRRIIKNLSEVILAVA